MSRLPRSRWARIGAWTGAALAWGTTIVMTQEKASGDASADEPQLDAALAELPAGSVLPNMPASGLVILRYAPIPVPEQVVVTRYVTVTVPVGSAAATAAATSPPSSVATGSSAVAATGGGGGSGTAQPPPPPPPPPTTVTTAPAPVSGGS